MIRQMPDKKGFTLVELLIAISILAIISAVGFTSFSQAQVRGRDAKRKSDLRSIAVALEVFYQKYKRYPYVCVGDGWARSSTDMWLVDTSAACGATGLNLAPNFINKMPVDPINVTPYIYQYFNYGGPWGTCATGQYYLLMVSLENPNDPDRYGARKFPVCGYNDAHGEDDIPWANNTFFISP